MFERVVKVSHIERGELRLVRSLFPLHFLVIWAFIVDVFEDIETEAVVRMASLSKERHLNEGDWIFREGEPAEVSFLVADGAVKITQKGEVICEVTGRGGFGPLETIAPGHAQIVSARAASRAHLLTFTKEDINYAVREYPDFALGVIRAPSAALIRHTGLRAVIRQEREREGE